MMNNTFVACAFGEILSSTSIIVGVETIKLEKLLVLKELGFEDMLDQERH